MGAGSLADWQARRVISGEPADVAAGSFFARVAVFGIIANFRFLPKADLLARDAASSTWIGLR